MKPHNTERYQKCTYTELYFPEATDYIRLHYYTVSVLCIIRCAVMQCFSRWVIVLHFAFLLFSRSTVCMLIWRTSVVHVHVLFKRSINITHKIVVTYYEYVIRPLYVTMIFVQELFTVAYCTKHVLWTGWPIKCMFDHTK